MLGRWVTSRWRRKLRTPYVHLVFGARQTGKSTLLKNLLPDAGLWLNFARPARKGYLVCRCSAPLALTDRLTALPWACL